MSPKGQPQVKGLSPSNKQAKIPQNVYSEFIFCSEWSCKWKSLSHVRLFATVHGILQARILEWVAFPFSRGSLQPRDRTQVSRIAGSFLTSWATREALPLWTKHNNWLNLLSDLKHLKRPCSEGRHLKAMGCV